MYRLNYSKVMYPNADFENEFNIIFSEYERQPETIREEITEEEIRELNRRLNELINNIK